MRNQLHEAHHDAFKAGDCFLLGKSLLFSESSFQISPITELQDQVVIMGGLEDVQDADDVLGFQFLHDLYFQKERIAYVFV